MLADRRANGGEMGFRHALQLRYRLRTDQHDGHVLRAVVLLVKAANAVSEVGPEHIDVTEG